ncbi:MAG: FHA domain-containing protein [Deltaproteobacteria bacterium]|nr:MAG: FHA domain-containing protein [Deltaproteobacteria bacterium]
MMARAAFRTPDGHLVSLAHGDLIGRLASAALVLDDPRVSEAHAMVSLRQNGLYLLGLRRPVRIGGKALSSVKLEVGLSIEFADDVALVVEEIVLPDAIPALEGEDLPRQQLPDVVSLYTRPRSRLVGKFQPDADAHLWSLSGSWRLRIDGRVRPLDTNESFEVAGKQFRIVAIGLSQAAARPTEQSGGVHAPMRVVTHYDTVQIQRDGSSTVLVTGLGARIISELAAVSCAMRWEELCNELWPGEDHPDHLRRRLDMALFRLRKRLRTERIPEELVRSTGSGMIELVLGPGDVLVDES